jgi:BirA family transcriptional regulator, biotin operon repressor / biotin---[acetyl-CoA-carboxylase] ligase
VFSNPADGLSLNMPMLQRLKRASGQFIALAELGADRARVWRDLEALEQFGFQIERHPYLGVSYQGPTSRLCPDQIEHGLVTRRIGRRIAVWNRVGSTNDLALQAGSNLANDGLVVLAEEQVSGRGQRGRQWTAPPRSSILMSVLLFPPARLARSGSDAGGGSAWLTALAAVAVAELVSRRTGAVARIKWPNDVRVEGRKIAGILVERALSPPVAAHPAGDGRPRPRGVVIGIGLNVELDLDIFPPELRGRVTSLARIGGRGDIDRSELARALIELLDEFYDRTINEGVTFLSPLWQARSEHLGKMVRVETASSRVAGRLVALDLSRGISLRPGAAGLADGQSMWIPLEAVLSLEE